MHHVLMVTTVLAAFTGPLTVVAPQPQPKLQVVQPHQPTLTIARPPVYQPLSVQPIYHPLTLK